MPNYGRERLNAIFSISIHKIEYLKLNKFNDTTHFQNVPLKGLLQKYEHELLYSRNQ